MIFRVRPQDVVCRLGVSYDNLLDINVYHPEIVANHGSFIPLKYPLTDLITQHLKHLCFMIYEVYTTHVHYQATQIKKCNFSTDSLKYG